MLAKLEKSKKVIGVKQTLKAVANKRTDLVFIAEDADTRVTGKLVDLCKSNDVKVIYVDTMKKLGKTCGVAVGASAAAIIKDDETI